MASAPVLIFQSDRSLEQWPCRRSGGHGVPVPRQPPRAVRNRGAAPEISEAWSRCARIAGSRCRRKGDSSVPDLLTADAYLCLDPVLLHADCRHDRAQTVRHGESASAAARAIRGRCQHRGDLRARGTIPGGHALVDDALSDDSSASCGLVGRSDQCRLGDAQTSAR